MILGQFFVGHYEETLPSAEASCVVGRLGRKKKGVCGGAPHAFYFFDYCYFDRDTQREPLRRREIKKETVEVRIV